jgi:hypothetical protein
MCPKNFDQLKNGAYEPIYKMCSQHIEKSKKFAANTPIINMRPKFV